MTTSFLHALPCKLSHWAVADVPRSVCPLWSQHPWSLMLPRLLFIGVGGAAAALARPRPRHHLPQELPAPVRSLHHPSIPLPQETRCVLRSATPLQVRPAPEQIPSATDCRNILQFEIQLIYLNPATTTRSIHTIHNIFNRKKKKSQSPTKHKKKPQKNPQPNTNEIHPKGKRNPQNQRPQKHPHNLKY